MLGVIIACAVTVDRASRVSASIPTVEPGQPTFIDPATVTTSVPTTPRTKRAGHTRTSCGGRIQICTSRRIVWKGESKWRVIAVIRMRLTRVAGRDGSGLLNKRPTSQAVANRVAPGPVVCTNEMFPNFYPSLALADSVPGSRSVIHADVDTLTRSQGSFNHTTWQPRCMRRPFMLRHPVREIGR